MWLSHGRVRLRAFGMARWLGERKEIRFHTEGDFTLAANQFFLEVPDRALAHAISEFIPVVNHSFRDRGRTKFTTSLAAFRSKAKGCFRLRVTLRHPDDEHVFQAYSSPPLEDASAHSILTDSFIPHYSHSIIRHKATAIDGLMMDAAFKLIKPYMASIVTAICYNLTIWHDSS
jgi:hypothetical protein